MNCSLKDNSYYGYATLNKNVTAVYVNIEAYAQNLFDKNRYNVIVNYTANICQFLEQANSDWFLKYVLETAKKSSILPERCPIKKVNKK